MSVKDALLGLLAQGPNHGYELQAAYNHVGVTRPVHSAQIYSTLARLLRDELVDVAGHEGGLGPARVVYRLTDQGRARVEAWLLAPESPEPFLQPVLLLKLLVARRAGVDVDEVVAAQQNAHLALMRELVRRRDSGDPVTQIASDYAIHHLEADLRWLEATPARLDSVEPAHD